MQTRSKQPSSFAGMFANRYRLASLSVIGSALLLAGCATQGPDHAVLAQISSEQLKLSKDSTSAVMSNWWTELGDAQLSSLIDSALKDRPNLQIARSRVYKAMSLAQLSESSRLPQVGLGADINRQGYSTNGLFGGLLRGTGLQSSTTSTLQTGINWNIDLWGMHAAQIAAALGEERAVEADLASAALWSACQITQVYIALAKMGTQLDVAQRTMEQRQEIYNLTRSRLQVGLDTKVEVAQAQSAYFEARMQREVVLEQIELIKHQLAALSAQPMSALDHLAPRLEQLSFKDIPAVVGADLLGRRPDVIAAKLRVEAASFDVSAAKKEFYPNINLVGYAGYNALKSNPLINPNSRAFGVDPAITLPIFDGGRLRAQLGAKRAELDAAVANYNETVLQAVREGSDVISSTSSIAKQRAEQAEALASAKTAYELSLERYRAGLGNYLIVLNTESQWLNQQKMQVDLLARQLDTRVMLIRTLGGGWQGEERTHAKLTPTRLPREVSPQTLERDASQSATEIASNSSPPQPLVTEQQSLQEGVQLSAAPTDLDALHAQAQVEATHTSD
jgi:NodT family efflux transporter outer membrane factor (OMF) lipoprotein